MALLTRHIIVHIPQPFQPRSARPNLSAWGHVGCRQPHGVPWDYEFALEFSFQARPQPGWRERRGGYWGYTVVLWES